MTDTEHTRLLICRDCKTIEPLADYTGEPEHDVMLDYLAGKHRTNGVEHIGVLARVETADWNDARKQQGIAKELATALSDGETGLGSEFYNTRDTFLDDAMSCFRQHQRNPDCSDYKSDAKRIMPATAQDRKSEGMGSYRGATRWLCEHCPVHSMVTTKAYNDAMKKGKL